MISFEKKPAPNTVPAKADENRFDLIRKAAVERHEKSDSDGTRRRHRQKAEDNRLI